MINKIILTQARLFWSIVVLFFFMSTSAKAALQVELGPAPGYDWIRVNGAFSPSIIFFTDPSWGGNIYTSFMRFSVEDSSPGTGGRREYDNLGISCTGLFTSESAIVSFVNNLVTGRTYSKTDGNLAPLGENTKAFVRLECWDSVNKRGVSILGSGSADGLEIINPPSSKSVCTLNSQNLNLNYSSTSLNVNGLTQSTSLAISCGSGDAQDYQLRLTGSNVTSGRLNFGNGVSAQVSLNGVQVSANGSGISLNGLTSRNLSVSATLVGTASTSGITNSNGVLVLDVL